MQNSNTYLEEAVLHAINIVAEQATDRITKILVDLFKSSILKKYKDAFDEELRQGKVHKKNVEKSIDFCFADACAAYRMLHGLTDEQKEKDIKAAESQLPVIKQTIFYILDSRNIEILL